MKVEASSRRRLIWPILGTHFLVKDSPRGPFHGPTLSFERLKLQSPAMRGRRWRSAQGEEDRLVSHAKLNASRLKNRRDSSVEELGDQCPFKHRIIAGKPDQSKAHFQTRLDLSTVWAENRIGGTSLKRSVLEPFDGSKGHVLAKGVSPRLLSSMG